jgi:hypothetical protein
MESKKLTELTEQELIEEEKKEKVSQRNYAFIIGLLFGIAVYSIVRNGFGFLPILLFIFALNFISKSKRYQEVKKEIEARKSI